MTLLFEKVADVYELLEKTSSGNRLRELLSSFFKKIPKAEISIVTYFTLGRIGSNYEDIDLGMAEKMILRAIAEASGKEALKDFKKRGDLGLTAQSLVGKRRRRLTVKEVFESLHKIANAKGVGSQEVKVRILADILKNASPKEAKYITRLVLGTLRLGVADMTVLDSLAIAFTGSKANKKKLEEAYNTCPDVGIIAKTIATRGLKGISNAGVMVGRPIQMMRAQRVKTIEEIIKKIPGVMAAEEKYDGERIQIHSLKGKITLFSRRLENITHQFPDVVNSVKNIRRKNFVVEGEIMAVDKKGSLLKFQTLMQRRRKYDVEEYVKKIPVCVYLFDALYLNGKTLIKKPYPERRKVLEKIVRESKNLKLAKRKVSSNLSEIQDFFEESIERNCEGIIVKSCDKNSFYETGKRGWKWIKWKKEYIKDVQETYDLAVVGAFSGRGRRAGSYGALLCAVYNKKKDIFETFCKLGAGFTDKQLDELPKKFKDYVVDKKPARVEAKKEMKPDFWFEPKIVVEVLGAEVTKSPLHTAANGLALRFPRFLRFREDKKAEQATTVEEVVRYFKK